MHFSFDYHFSLFAPDDHFYQKMQGDFFINYQV